MEESPVLDLYPPLPPLLDMGGACDWKERQMPANSARSFISQHQPAS